ncbi:hypothetical protein OIC43_09270 [Streptomyces sp. NBC_00825]|nr:hypothetical protein OG832_34430 [Streptomyces sp. NBC_00826]WTH89218.1 hypothetical protein OIC43_09270 [Streptomyces sp. NBC_00825]WTH97943.1 hypothetical protein OHA23_09255 [Streptomyces sp. NBC_00822]
METAQFIAFSGPPTALLTLAHPERRVRARAERLLAVIFRAR